LEPTIASGGISARVEMIPLTLAFVKSDDLELNDLALLLDAMSQMDDGVCQPGHSRPAVCGNLLETMGGHTRQTHVALSNV
jgi:hypothetical protein